MAIRWGICSAGRISHDFTVALKSRPAEDHQVVAVAARKLEDAQEFSRTHNISKAYGSYEELARDPDIDVVYVGVIHPYHLKACKLFTNSKKNVLCEKPLAMNIREVREILDSAKKNDVFLMEAVWTRFFQACVEIRRLLAQEYIGEVKMVRADYGVPLLHVPSSVQKELGGAILDLGIYCLQFINVVYNGEKPESIQASGVCLDNGVEETVTVILKYSKNRMATFTCSAVVKLPNDAVIVGTEGKIQVLSPMWCPTSLLVVRKETQSPEPESFYPLNFTNSPGRRYEAEEVRYCLLKGLKESPIIPLAYTLLLAEMEDEIRRQVGVVYSEDCHNVATRWGICSVGKISHDFTVALKTLPAEDHQVVAVAARKLEDAQEFSTKHNISKAYGSYEELARDPDIDVVYVGVIHPYHLKACKLFTNAKKNVLCEKPLAMNTKEVREILDSAKKNDVFLMEAVWTRFFPVSVEIRKLLAQEYIGEVKMVRADFGVPLLHVPRLVQKELGGGALLDLGIYCLQFINMVYKGEKPESIQASGVCLETGVDETVTVILKYSKNRMAMFTCSTRVQLPNDAVIGGTEGTIQVLSPMWCPTSLFVNGKETQYPVPEPSLPLNFTNSTGMCYEAEEVRQCLLKGLKESPVMPHADSLLLAEMEDEIRRQVGVVYSQDCQ
ncbi:trans-1,2-dihydrobenzene-1,2-diol dehydrogenase-like isoform X2 [Gambusia affinis]|uniref:trans-1,2-dihydrobenzene-1,2-diol dehydrogenase-like isoform X2 n=1 Tax=Gambusia affinis TaxID=33528 RepID=UPI001CDB996D|nr:trans-1,2-dihydrobenzene-1,2-diol dehydrogenase-like isoform X2 [Gambusia affinis]